MNKIRVAYISASSGDWGGASRVLFTNIKLLDKQVIEPIVFLPDKGPILSTLEQLNIKYILWGGMHEPDKLWKYALEIIKLIRLFKKEKIDILHINHANYWRPAEIIAAKVLRIPIITHYHVVIKEPGPFVKYSNRIITVSDYTSKESLPNDIPKVIIHNAVDLERYEKASDIRNELNINSDHVVSSFIGQIRDIKGVDVFIKMAKAIKIKNARFLIVGECRDPIKFPGSFSVEQIKSMIGNDKRIIYIGYRTDIQNIYKSSDIIVMPSKWGEPFGLINIEAGAARKPIVATNVGGIPDIIKQGENGFLVTNGNLDELVKQTEKLIDDSELRYRMGEVAFNMVKEKYNQSPIKILESLYKNMIL